MQSNKFAHLKLKVFQQDFKYVIFSHEMSFWKTADVLRTLPSEELYFLFRCDGESSMVIPSHCKISVTTKEEPDWKAIRVVGEMPFGTVQGLIASIANVLQKSNIGICAVSTYLTDVFFVKAKQFNGAQNALKNEGWEFIS